MQLLLQTRYGGSTSGCASCMQLPSLHRSMQEAANILGVEPPELYIRQVGHALP